MSSIIALLALTGSGVYLTRVLTRAASRASASSGAAAGAAAATAHHATGGGGAALHQRYRAFERGGFQPRMTDAEALLILGFDASDANVAFSRRPSAEEIRERYRHCVAQLHADVAGSSYLASKINEARDTLLKS